MAGKFKLLAGMGAGYLLGARAGRGRYDQIARTAKSVWRDPRVQDKAHQAQHLAKEKAAGAGSTIADKVGSRDKPASDGIGR